MPTLNFQTKLIKESSAELFIPTQEKISKKLPVFYNPVMALNRDITILLLKQFPPLHLCDPLAGTGIRSIRFAKELKYTSITANDISKTAVALIKKNMKHNKVKFNIYNKDANLLLLESKGFDFIDLDVFGSPNFLLNSAIARLSRNGILAITATDTAPLAGTYPKTCLRKYWALPKKDHMMHETGLRILIRKAQLIAAQHDKALIPIFSYFKDHYLRAFFKCIKGKKEADKIIKQHGTFNNAGPLWLGQLFDQSIIKKILNSLEKDDKNKKIIELKSLKKIRNNKNEVIEPKDNSLKGNKNKRIEIEKNKINNNELTRFLSIIYEESKMNTVGFYSIPQLCKKYKLTIPKKDAIIRSLKKKGFKATSTHFTPEGVRSDCGEGDIVKIMKKC